MKTWDWVLINQATSGAILRSRIKSRSLGDGWDKFGQEISTKVGKYKISKILAGIGWEIEIGGISYLVTAYFQ